MSITLWWRRGDSYLRLATKLIVMIICQMFFFHLLHRFFIDTKDYSLITPSDTDKSHKKPISTVPTERDVLWTLRKRSERIHYLCKNNTERAFKQISPKRNNNDNLKKLSYDWMIKTSLKNILVMPDKHLIWCPVPKVASTSIGAALIEANNQTSKLTAKERLAPQVYLRSKVYKSVPPSSLLQDPSSGFKAFYVTRHPFDRVVSAYRNKLEDMTVHDGQYFYNKYGKQIVRKYRKTPAITKLTNCSEETLKKFLNKKEPTFEEFIQYLLHTKKESYDEHWRPIWLLCNVCLFPYDFVVQLENFETEADALIAFLKNENHIPQNFEIKWQNSARNLKNNGEENQQTNKITKYYMNKLSKSVVKELFEIYKHDFEYFGYDANDYL